MITINSVPLIDYLIAEYYKAGGLQNFTSEDLVENIIIVCLTYLYQNRKC